MLGPVVASLKGSLNLILYGNNSTNCSIEKKETPSHKRVCDGVPVRDRRYGIKGVPVESVFPVRDQLTPERIGEGFDNFNIDEVSNQLDRIGRPEVDHAIVFGPS